MDLLVGIIVGFVAAIPIGPINVYAVTQTLKRDYVHGMLVGFTSALLDMLFCLAALTGMRQVILQLQALTLHFKGLGSIILVIIAIRLFLQARREGEEEELVDEEAITHHKPIITTVLMYITNPSLYAFWIGVGGMISAHTMIDTSTFDPLVFAFACGLGTLLWYIALVRYVWRRHHTLSKHTVKNLLYATSVILFIIALYLLIKVW